MKPSPSSPANRPGVESSTFEAAAGGRWPSSVARESAIISTSPDPSTIANLDRNIPLGTSQHSTTSRRVTFRVTDDPDTRLASPLSAPALGSGSERGRHDEQQQPFDSRSGIRSSWTIRESPSSVGSVAPLLGSGAFGAAGNGVNGSSNAVATGQPGTTARRSTSNASSSTNGASLRLDYSARDLSFVPPEFAAHKYAPRVKAVDLSRNNLSTIAPTTFDRFSHLRRLNLTRNRLESLSTSAFTASYTLAWLDLSNNPTLCSIDPNLLTGLRALRHLGIANCGLVELPSAIGHLVHLAQLSAFGNRFEAVPKEIGELRNLVRLDLSGNRISRLPNEIGRLIALEWLNLNENQLSWLPDEMNQLTHLREMGLASNRLESLPDIFSLQSLTSLIIYRNRLAFLPNSLATLGSLTHLDLSRNRLTHLPPALFAMANLRRLFLQGNRLTSLPGRFRFSHKSSSTPNTSLPSSPSRPTASASLTLAHLDLSNNQLSSLPWPLLSRPLKTLRMYGNPLLAAPPATPGTVPTAHMVLARTRPRGRPPRLVTLALNAVLASQPMFRAARALSAGGHTAGQVSVRVFGMLRGDGVEERELSSGAWVPHRRCDHCLRLYVTDRDVCEMTGAEWAEQGQDDGSYEPDQVVGDAERSTAGDQLANEPHSWYTAVLLCPRVLPDHRDIPCEFGFCSTTCWAAWKPPAGHGSSQWVWN